VCRLTGAGEQPEAEVIDEQGDTVPLPAVPPAPPPETADRVDGARRFPPTFGPIVRKVALGVAVCLVAGAGYAGLRQIADAPADPGAPTTAESPQTSTTPDEAAEGVRRASVGGAVLQRMSTAVEDDSRSAFLATIDPRATEFRESARTMFANLGKLPIGSFALRYVSDDTGALAPERQAALGGSESWLAQVEVSWQLSGYDAKPARETMPVTFVTRDGTTYAASFSERFVAGQRRPVWALGPIYGGRVGQQGLGPELAPEGGRLSARQTSPDGVRARCAAEHLLPDRRCHDG
jgi:hypothetical protein